MTATKRQRDLLQLTYRLHPRAFTSLSRGEASLLLDYARGEGKLKGDRTPVVLSDDDLARVRSLEARIKADGQRSALTTRLDERLREITAAHVSPLTS